MQYITKKYTFDANIFINLAKEHYPIDIFPGLWTQIISFIEAGNLQVIDYIYEEVQDPSVLDVFKDVEKYFLVNIEDLDKVDDIQKTVTSNLSSTPEIIDTSKGKNGGDPWIISYAKHYDLTLVTSEKKGGSYKIPNVCAHQKVRCINLHDFFREVGINL